MAGSDLLVRDEGVSEPNYQKPGSNDMKPLFSDGPDKRKALPMEPAPVRTVVLDMGEASREQGFRLNGCR